MQQRQLKEKLHEIIFGTETPAGKRFDELLIIAILLSVAALIMESVKMVDRRYHDYLVMAEWTFTILFTIEYIVRIYISPNRWKYISSFYGVIDLIAVLPSYLGLFITGANYLLVVRLLRVLRVFRVLKLVRYLSEANVLMRSIMSSRRKIFIFFIAVLVLATVFGSLMYVVEGPEHGFTSIPKSIYWTIVTITTVGYGDIVPQTIFGQIIATLAMLTGYSIIAVPTGILTAELTQEISRERQFRRCGACDRHGHDADASFCKFCGGAME